jgi:hypothetical protein
MGKLPKSLIKKYGISKKAWAVFRGQKTKPTKRQKMTKRKKYFGKKGKSGFSFGKALQILGGAVAAAAYEVFVSPMIPLSSMIKNIIELVVGLALALMPRMPLIVRGFGAALATVNTYALVYPMIAGSSSSSSSSAGLGW